MHCLGLKGDPVLLVAVKSSHHLSSINYMRWRLALAIAKSRYGRGRKRRDFSVLNVRELLPGSSICNAMGVFVC
jgi:hypothetical protein